jgi:hypothetical protein
VSPCFVRLFDVFAGKDRAVDDLQQGGLRR